MVLGLSIFNSTNLNSGFLILQGFGSTSLGSLAFVLNDRFWLVLEEASGVCFFFGGGSIVWKSTWKSRLGAQLLVANEGTHKEKEPKWDGSASRLLPRDVSLRF